MLLMIFFVMLVGMTLQRLTRVEASQASSLSVPIQSKEQPIPNPVIPPAEPVPKDRYAALEKDLTAALSREKGEQQLMVERKADLVLLTFPESIVFDPGQAELKPFAQATLNKVASYIMVRPYLNIEIQGHTDDRPIHNVRYPSNWELSVDRATQVAKALMSMGVNPEQVSVKGFGEYRPLLPNDRDSNRFKNRRVEIQFSISPPSRDASQIFDY
jgi:chemotaxis protein MotB